MIPSTSTNLKNRVNKLYLPRTKALYPLYELISNSIHAIQERNSYLENDEKVQGEINVKLVRTGAQSSIDSIKDINEYPVESFIVVDNGIGLNEDNFLSFTEFDSDKKAEIGGKGVGRLVCLKVFRQLEVDSVFISKDSTWKNKKFDYKRTKNGFENYEETDILEESKKIGTKVKLYRFEEQYQKHAPNDIDEIGRQIIYHFQLYFIQNLEPRIILSDQKNNRVNLSTLYKSEFAKEVIEGKFELNDQLFTVFITKSYNARSHKIHYCAHQRTVVSEGIYKYIEDFKSKVIIEDESFYYQFFVVGNYLDDNVNEARSGFYFSLSESDDGELDNSAITLARIRKKLVDKIEELLERVLTGIREEKLKKYIPIIEQEYPNYNAVLHYNMDKVRKLPPGLSSNELDIKLYEIESEWRSNVKKEGILLLDEKVDITELEDYKSLYENFLTEFNEVGQADLARYIVHRRSVIDLLDRLIKLNAENKFENEEIVHSLFFPVRETRNTVTHEKQNLWLLDERLTFNMMLASDKTFNSIEETDSNSSRRMDIVVKQGEVYDKAVLFSEDKTPFESFTIIEFKKPERDNYVHGDRAKDPVKQIRSYIEELIDGKSRVDGKKVGANERTPFYCYIVADITDTLEYIVEYEGFTRTPDGMGYFKFYDLKKYKAYIEVVPFIKVIKDAKQRNKVLFDKLKLS